jgi:hypothetical protein
MHYVAREEIHYVEKRHALIEVVLERFNAFLTPGLNTLRGFAKWRGAVAWARHTHAAKRQNIILSPTARKGPGGDIRFGPIEQAIGQHTFVGKHSSVGLLIQTVWDGSSTQDDLN